MSTYDDVPGYRHGYQEDYEELQEVHPDVRRRAWRIVQADRMSRLRQAWISSVGALAITAEGSSTVLSWMNQMSLAWMLTVLAMALTAYLVSKALGPEMIH